ncbi:MAG: hypothetical protein HZA52_12325 [Planctomycetes bacterium]|nr:hypothetical protein [Planctomycetota bacterium]
MSPRHTAVAIACGGTRKNWCGSVVDEDRDGRLDHPYSVDGAQWAAQFGEPSTWLAVYD